MSVRADHPLREVVSTAERPVLVVHDPGAAGLVADLADEGVVVCPVGGPIPQAPRRWAAVALVSADEVSLRRAVSVLPPPGRTRLLAWWLTEADRPALLLPRPEWPPLLALHGRLVADGGAVTTMRVDGPVAVRAVLGQVARDLAPGVGGQHGVVVATTSADPAAAPPADTGLVVAGTATAAADPDRKVPPDVVVTEEHPGLPRHEVLGRAPVTVTGAAAPTPVDEGLLNPRGFLRRPTRGEARLDSEPDGGLRVHGDGLDLLLPHDEVTPSLVSALRHHRAVRVTGGGSRPPALARAVTALAVTGIPLLDDADPGTTLDDDLVREEHSVRLRRTALLEHSTLAWRERLAAAAGTRFRRFPRCTVLLWGSDPERLGAVQQQLADQRGVDLDVVVVAPGPDAAGLAEGVAAATGDVVVLTDDATHHGPDVVGDLLLARHYSGARVVEMPPGPGPDLVTEEWVTTLSGGPVAVDRAALRAVVRSLGAALAGGGVYRTHGLGVARRDTSTGAPWLTRI